MKKYAINKDNIINVYSIISLILLFPMSFFYHSIVSIYGIPRFLGGYFSIMGAILLFGYIFIYLFRSVNLRKDTLFFYFFITVWVLFISIEYVLSINVLNEELFVWGITAILANLICFNIASNLDLNSIFIKKYLKYFIYLYSLIIFSNIYNGQFSLGTQIENKDSVSYQSFALYIVVVSLISVVAVKSIKEKIFLFLLSFLILYLNGARSEFVFFVVSIMILSFLEFKVSAKNIMFVLSSTIVVFVSIYFINGLVAIEENRIFQLANISESSSYLARQKLNEIAILVIKDNPLTGDYGYYVKELGIGNYAHNVLSAWADFGFFGFLVFLSIPIYTTMYSLVCIYKLKRPSTTMKILFVFSVSLLLAYIFAQDYSYMFLGLVVGFYINTHKDKTKYYEKNSTSYISSSKN